MMRAISRAGLNRRTLVKTGLVLAAAQFASPFVIRARAADAVRIGLDNPLTGTYAANGKHELEGCQLALDEINAKGGILGRPAELVVEDSTSGDAGAAVQKARKLIESDKVDFLLGNVNSALALAMAQVRARRVSFTSCRAATPTRSPARAATGTCSGSATPPRWRPTRSPAR